ncbi:MAG: NUDIX hydrolase [Clostridia bacterium]|nr:NUDIX hydrolase [Clostridia bacterium]
MDNLIEKEVNAHTLYSGKIINLRVDDIALPNGDCAIREYVEHKGGAAVLPIDNEGNAYLVKQFRYPYRELLLEIPAGKLEVGEPPIVTATRELKEETGFVGKVEPYGVLYPTPGYTNEKLYIFVATELEKGDMCLDNDEFLEVVKVPLEELTEWVLSGKIKDAKTAYAVLRYALTAHK